MYWQNFSSQHLQKCKQLEMPHYACFELTPYCNFSCNMCYIRLTPDQANAQGRLLNTVEWISLAEKAKKMGTVSLELTGGEAVTRPDFSDLYKAFIKMGYIINLRSNGYLLNGNLFSLLKEYKPYQIAITVYGASDTTYHKICGVKDGFTIVKDNIIALRKSGFNVHLTMTVTKENIHDFRTAKEWAAGLDLELHPYGGLITPIRGAKRSIDHLKIDFNSHQNSDNSQYTLGSRDILNRDYYMNPFWMCKGFGAMFCITWDGRMTLCNSMHSVWKDPFATEFDIVYHDLYRDLKKLRRAAKCESCNIIDYCGSCPARALSETGDPNGISDKICSRAFLTYTTRVKHEQVKTNLTPYGNNVFKGECEYEN